MNRLYTVMEVASSNFVTIPFFILFIFYLFIYRYNCLNIIHNQFQIISVAEYHYNDNKQFIPYLVDAFPVAPRLCISCLLMSHLRDTMYKC